MYPYSVLILNDNEHFSEYVFTEIDSQIVF